MENLFMQVFDRRDWVAGQMRQQVDSHAESLACAFLAAGHRPPPWLLPSCAAAPQELNGKPIVPGLLFPGSQMTTPATRRTVFQPPAVPSTSLGNVVVLNGYASLETICDTVDTNQHEVPQQKQVSVDQEIAEVSAGGNMFSVPQKKQVSVDQEIAELSAGVNMFSMVKRSRSRQRHIEDRSREMVKAANSGTSDVMQDRMLRSELATAGSNRTTASLSSKPCGDGEINAGTTAISLPGQEKDLYANQDRSTEFVKCSKDDDLGNQGVQLDCSQNQIVSSDNNVKVFNNCSVRSSLGVQVTGSVCHALRETYLSVEPKKLQFDGVESVCMNPASEQMVHQPVCALESANADVAEARPLNEDPSSTSYSQVPHYMGRLLLDGVESGYLNPETASVKQQQKSSLKCASLDLTVAHSGKEDQSPASSPEVPNPTSILLVERDILHTVEDTERITKPSSFSDWIITKSSESFERQCFVSHVSHPPYCETLQSPTQLADTSSGDPASPQILPDSLLGEAGSEDLSHSPVNDVDNHPSKTQSNDTHSNGCPVVNASLSEENDLSQEQHFLARTSLEFNDTDVESPLGPASQVTHHGTHDGKPAYDAVNISASNKRDESVVPEVMSSGSARRASEMYTAERNNMTSAEDLQQDGTEQDTSLTENAVKENANSCTAENNKRKISQPSVQYLLHSAVSHEKINLLESDRRSAACDQKRSVQDGVKVNGSLSSKRRRIRSQSDFDLSRTPCANSLSLNHQVDIAGHMLTATNLSAKSHPSDYYSLRSSGSCKSMTASNCKISVASEIYGDGHSSRGRRSTISQFNAVLDNSPTASTSRSAMEGRVFENSQEQIQNKLEAEFLTTAVLPCRSGILSHNEENFIQQEGTCLEGQDLNVTTASVADQEMALEMDTLSPPIAILNKHLGDESFDCDDSMPVFQSFEVHDQFDSPIVGKGSFEALYDSQQLGTFGSDPPNRYNTNTARSLHQLLTSLSGKPRNRPLSDDLKQYSAGNSHSSMDSVGCGLELDPFYAVASCSSNASIRQENNETPLTPSVEKYSQQKLPSRSGSGSEQMGSIPELEIFRIDEDNSIPEEDEYQDRLPGSVDMNHSCQLPSGRTALEHITGLCQNNENSPSLSMRCMDKGNIDLSAESASGELTHHSNIRNDSIKTKYNHPTSVKRKGTVSCSLRDRHRSEANVDKQGTTEPLNSRKGRHRSEANVVRQSKPSNIVANVTSFVPLVKQKLQSTTVCVKKDVKVKALKAAEAAKRLEEKKQKEQEQRKAAAKAERERLKQEKELKQKLEDEQKKKREVDAAANKRQREEGEKRETMKKRKCTDEARKQQKQPMDRQRGTKDEKDARQKASDNMEPRKNLVDVGKNQVKSDETTEHALQYKANESKDEKGVAVDDRNASFGSDDKENILNSLEESYAMSPYKDSDDEDDDDYDEHEQEVRRRRKFVPSWARKENLDNILLSNKALDPREIFAQKLSFNIPEVLSAHIPQRILR